MYNVEIDWSPAYELWISLIAFASKPDQKTLDLGMDWVRTVGNQIEADLRARLEEPGGGVKFPVQLLVKQAPGERSPESFLTWLQSLSPGELYERVQPWIGEHSKHAASKLFMLRDLADNRDNAVELLREWNTQYFRSIDSRILAGLAAEAESRRNARGVAPDDLVEDATQGVYYEPSGDFQTIVLVPQYHFRPWNIYDRFNLGLFICYPAEALPLAPGEPPTRLVRLSRALSEEARLRILHLLASGPLRFTDIVESMGLSKSTVHHHMVNLRAAGLVRGINSHEPGPELYELRTKGVEQVGRILADYINSSDEATAPRQLVTAGDVAAIPKTKR